VWIALGIVALFGIIQWRGIRWGSRVQNLTSLLKTMAFVALVVACFLLSGNHNVLASQAPEVPVGYSFLLR
jgi:APA family basic amino acid/polyamine antiporter